MLTKSIDVVKVKGDYKYIKEEVDRRFHAMF